MFYIYNWVYLPNTVEYVELAKAATWASCTNEFLQTVKTKEKKNQKSIGEVAYISLYTTLNVSIFNIF